MRPARRRIFAFADFSCAGVAMSARESTAISSFSASPCAVGSKLAAHRLVSVARVIAGHVDEMDQRTAALDMAEETVADPRTLVRALDQPRNVGEHELRALVADDAEVRMQRREGIVGDLRLRRGDARKQRGLPGIRQADDADIGDELQPEPNPLLFAFLAGIGAARRAVGGGLEMRVAEAAVPAFGQKLALAELGEVGDQRLVIVLEYLRADRARGAPRRRPWRRGGRGPCRGRRSSP